MVHVYNIYSQLSTALTINININLTLIYAAHYCANIFFKKKTNLGRLRKSSKS